MVRKKAKAQSEGLSGETFAGYAQRVHETSRAWRKRHGNAPTMILPGTLANMPGCIIVCDARTSRVDFEGSLPIIIDEAAFVPIPEGYEEEIYFTVSAFIMLEKKYADDPNGYEKFTVQELRALREQARAEFDHWLATHAA